MDDIQGLGLGLGQSLDEMQGLGLSGLPSQEEQDLARQMHDNHSIHHDDDEEDGDGGEEGSGSGRSREERARERRVNAQRRAMEAAEAQWRAEDEEEFFARLQRQFTYVSTFSCLFVCLFACLYDDTNSMCYSVTSL